MCRWDSLNVAGTLVDGTNLAVTPVLLSQTLAHETHATHPLNGETAHPASDLGGVELGHGGVLDEVLAGLLLAGGVVDEGASGGDLGVGLGDLVLHALELADELAELAAVVEDVLDGVLKGAEGEARHLGGDADAALVEEADGVLVALAALAEDVLLGDVHVVKVDDAGRRGLDAELLLLLGDAEAGGVLGDEEGGDALVALAGVKVGEDDEELRLHRVGDPHLAAVDGEAVGRLGGLGGHGEGVGARDGLAEAEGGDGARGELGEPLLLVGLGGVLDDGGVAQRVVHVDEDAHAGVGAGELLDADDGRGEVHARAAVLLGDLDAHEPLLKELLDNGRVHGLGLVHVAGAGQDHVRGELVDHLRHGGLGLGEVGDGRGGDVRQVQASVAGAEGRGCGEGANAGDSSLATWRS